jgi:hypothetical protein
MKLAPHRELAIAATTLIAMTLTVVLGAQAPAPGPLAPFGVTEAAARTKILEAAQKGVSFVSAFEGTLERGYDKVAADRRGPATAAAFAWLKAFVSSPAFTTPDAKARTENKPEGALTMSVDEEVHTKIAHDIAELEASKQNLQKVPGLQPADRAAATAEIDKTIANMRSPEYAANLRRMQEAGRTDRDAAQTAQTATWEKKWPADPRGYVRMHLETYLADTAAVDFVTPTIFVKDDAGATVGFLRAGMTSMTRETMYAILIGKPATDAARNFCDGWLKGLK